MSKEEANIKPITQIRLGGQYRYIYNPKRIIINLRAGLFYDPEPTANRADDFYGVSVGTGITFNNSYSFDVMYQFRFGKKKAFESIMSQDVSGRVTQHYIYTSLIYYF
jgi:long-subunit fatty acid transport protein